MKETPPIHGQIYTIPAGIPFLKTLASTLLHQNIYTDAPLESIKILLPTRRSCRALQHAFLKENHTEQAMLLPHLHPLGDVDEEELSLSSLHTKPDIKHTTALPPELPPIKRQILLARLIQARPDFCQGFDRALELAKALTHLMDQIHTESLDLKDLAKLVPDEFADHWQITLEFLDILSAAWPKILQDENAIDSADRRNRLIRMLTDFWRDQPPQTPIIVAGTTGSIPATADLLSAVLAMPKGMIILPGLDQDIDEESWKALGETHPQYGLKQLLLHLGINRQDVKLWPHIQTNETTTARQILAREIMRPAETSKLWAEWANNEQPCHIPDEAYKNLNFYECETQHEEAQIIAMILRQTLETPEKTACVITPDRSLAARIVSACRRWDIEIDDSAGTPLSQTKLGQLLFLTLEACLSNCAPMDILALLQHPFINLGLEPATYKQKTAALDIALRGQKAPPHFKGLQRHILRHDRLSETHRTEALDLLEILQDRFAPLLTQCQDKQSFSFSRFLQEHLKLCESLTNNPEKLWRNNEGQTASSFFSNMLQQSATMTPINLTEYKGTLSLFMSSITLRPTYGLNPRLQILGQLEARMIDADLVILGSLNENIWPPDAGADPWMSRPMRKEFGLPSLERGTGLAAHDFVQGLCAQNLVLTRSKRQGNAPSVPSRWLQRLDIVMEANGKDMRDYLGNTALQEWAKTLDHTPEFLPAERPAPTPPLSARPRRLSVTKIETWLHDPYSIYAGSILKLKPLDDIEKPIDAAARGTLLHNILEHFIKDHPKDLPKNTKNIIQTIAHDLTKDDPAAWHFWWPRLENIAQWYEDHEQNWRTQATPLKTEITGEITLTAPTGDFCLSCRADRIDKMHNGQAAIIDYKSGGTFSKKKLENADFPQLPLEALILEAGGFQNIPPMSTAYIGYWIMTGGRPVGKTTEATENLASTMDKIKNSLQTLIEHFDKEDTPYLSLPRPDHPPRFNDYLHLARVAEWSALEDNDDETEAA